MKLLFIIHALTGGGAERVMVTLMNKLCQRGYDIALLTDLDEPFAYEVDDRVELVNIHRPCPNNLRGIRRRFWGYSVIREVAKESQCDVVVSFLVEMNCAVILSLLGTGIPVICSEHSNVLRSYPKMVIFKRNLLYRLANVVTVLTHHDYKLWKRKFKNCVRMPNPCDLTSNNSNHERNRTILAVGRVNQWDIKGFDNLIRAWGKICQSFPDWKLQIVGYYDESSLVELNKVIDDCKAEHIEFLGFRKDIGDLMNNSSIFCLSSRVEGLPMALIEAMDRGCCCVAYDCITGPNEIIKDGYSGLLAKAGSVLDLSIKLDSVLSDKDLRIKLSMNAPSSVEQYSTDSVINRWEILFRKMLKNNDEVC